MRCLCVAFVLLLVGSPWLAGAAHRDTAATPIIPLCPSLTIVTAVNQQNGDYESIKTIESVTVGIQSALEQEGYEVVRMERRIVRQGPFLWTTTPAQIVFRLLVHEAGGWQRTVWGRWGRRWLQQRDAIELLWEE